MLPLQIDIWGINSTDYNALFVFPENLGPFYAKVCGWQQESATEDARSWLLAPDLRCTL
jgi:hypothetical protein